MLHTATFLLHGGTFREPTSHHSLADGSAIMQTITYITQLDAGISGGEEELCHFTPAYTLRPPKICPTNASVMQPNRHSFFPLLLVTARNPPLPEYANYTQRPPSTWNVLSASARLSLQDSPYLQVHASNEFSLITRQIATSIGDVCGSTSTAQRYCGDE